MIEESLIIPLRGSQIFYLDKNHLDQNLDVTLISESGEKIGVNHLQLVALTRDFLFEQLFDENIFITTNLNFKDLKMVANFITEGILPLPQDTLRAKIPENISAIFSSFGIFLDQLFLKKEELCQVKVEEYANEFQPEFFNSEDFDDLDFAQFETKETKPKKSRKRKVSNSDEEDEDWKPLKLAKKSSATKFEPFDEDLPAKEPQKRGRKKKDSKLSRSERDVKTQCEKFLKKYSEFANLSIPSEENPESRLFETFEINLENYLCQPKKLDKIVAAQDLTHPYPCQSCPAWFNNQYSLKNHELVFHSQHYQCTYCKHVSPLDQAEDFKVHIFRHEIRKHECIQCGFVNANLKTLEAHFKAEGAFHKNKCAQCDQKFSSFAAHKSHIETQHSGQWKLVCGTCDLTFDTIEQVKEHKSKEHKNASKKPSNGLKMCDLCGKEVTSLASHHKIHHEENPIKCPECPKICKTKYHLDDHIKGTHSRIPCEHCGLMIPIRRKERHIQQAHVNPEDRKYKCDHCGKGFTDRQKLNDHINTHTGERPYVCKYCGKGFANHGNQRAHIRQAHLGQKRNYRK